MAIIMFIKASAFIISIFARIIALPFIAVKWLLGQCLQGVKFCRKRYGNFREERRIKRERKKIQKEEAQKRRKHIREEKKALKKMRAQERSLKRKAEVKSTGFLYKGCRSIYIILRGVCGKIYTVFRKLYWRGRVLLQKIYWKIYTVFQKIYWKSYVILQKIYWNYYTESRKIFQRLTRNHYIDLFFVFFRRYIHNLHSDLKCARILSTESYISRCQRNAYYAVIENSALRTVCIPEYFEKSQKELDEFESPDIYVAELNNICIIGGSNVVTGKNFLINDAVYFDKGKRIDIRYSAIKNVINHVAIIEDAKETNVIEKGVNLTGAASFNYYHLVVEILSRLTFVDVNCRYREYPILVDEVVLRIPQFHAALDCVNKFNHPIIKIEQGKKYLINSLVLPSSNVWMPTNIYNRDLIRTSDFLISKAVLDNIRNVVGVVNKEKANRKIFISRKNTQAVRLKNEEVVRKIFQENGFEIIYTEEMTFRQQVECFGQAKCVVATSGAALTNIIFCQPETLIGCIIPSEHRFYMYSTIAHLLRLNPVFLDAKIVEKTPYAAADSFVLDEDYVRRYVAWVNSRY